MTYRHSDYRDYPSPRDGRNLHSDHRDAERDPYFSRDTEPASLNHLSEAENREYQRYSDYRDYDAQQDRYEHERAHDEYIYAENSPVDDHIDRDFNSLGDGRTDPYIDNGSAPQPAEGIRISESDLRDTNLASPFPKFGSSTAKVIAITGFSILAVLLYLSLRPDVTAYDIISMEEYKVPQQPAQTLDPEQVNGCESLSDCFKRELDSSALTTDDHIDVMEIPASTTVVSKPRKAESQSVAPTHMQVSQQWSNIRETPGMSGAIIGSIGIDLEVEILTRENDWYEIVTLDGRNIRGYMHSKTLK